MLDKLLGGLTAPFTSGNPLDSIGSGSVGSALGLDPVGALLKGGLGGRNAVEAAPVHAGARGEAAHTELLDGDGPEGLDGYARAEGEAGPGAPGPGGLSGLLAKLADPLGLFGGINLGDPLGLLGGGGGLSGLLGAEDGAKAEGLLGAQARMGGLLSMFGSNAGSASSLLGLLK